MTDSPTPDVSLREKAERLVTARAVQAVGKYDRQNPAWQEFMAALDAYDDAVSDPAVIVALFDERDSLRSRVERAEAEVKVLEGCRAALRSIGPVYWHVESAARRAEKAGKEKAAEALDHVHGRLFWLDFALGTLSEHTDATPFHPIPLETRHAV